MRYNPIEPPDPAVWRGLDAQERLILIEDFHRRAGDEAQSPQLHAVVHATVEDQVAAGEAIVCKTLARLQNEGLDRHEAIHAIGSIMTNHLYAALKSKAEPGNLHDAYLADVETLTADRWRAEAAGNLDDQDRNDPLGDGADPGPLSAAELAQLGAFLAGIKSGDSLTLEGLDGFFCALIAGPELVLPNEYLPVVWGGSTPGDGVFADAGEASTILQLMMRHWNAIIAELETYSVYEMLLGEPGERGLVGRAWARGFMRGVAMRRASWRELFTDQNEGQLLTIPLVAGEIDPDFPPEPLPAEKVEQLVLWMGAGLGRAYRHFTKRRRTAAPDYAAARTVRRDGRKVGRNDPCPCGSGKKFKRCCGAEGAPTSP